MYKNIYKNTSQYVKGEILIFTNNYIYINTVTNTVTNIYKYITVNKSLRHQCPSIVCKMEGSPRNQELQPTLGY